jgi:hypothetical protein
MHSHDKIRYPKQIARMLFVKPQNFQCNHLPNWQGLITTSSFITLLFFSLSYFFPRTTAQVRGLHHFSPFLSYLKRKTNKVSIGMQAGRREYRMSNYQGELPTCLAASLSRCLAVSLPRYLNLLYKSPGYINMVKISLSSESLTS